MHVYVFNKTCSIVRRYLYERIFIADVLTGAMIVVLGISGVMDLLGGFLGLRAAKDPGKTTAALVFGILAVIPGAISLIMETSTENICGLIIPVLYLVCVIAIRGSREN